MRPSATTLSTFTKFVIAGVLTALFDLGLLKLLVTAGMEHVTASVIAYIVALVVNFMLQKFWSFGDNETSRVHVQLAQFTTVGLINLGINTVSMYVLTYKVGLGYLTAQIIILPVLALGSYAIYRFVIFRR